MFSGSLQGRNPRETGAKGAIWITVENGRVTEVTPLVLDGARWGHLRIEVSSDTTEAKIFGRVKAALEAAQTESEGRPLAARITLTGTTSLHNKLAQQEELLDDLRAAGSQAAADCWVEQVRIETSPPPAALPHARDTRSIDVEGLLSAAATIRNSRPRCPI